MLKKVLALMFILSILLSFTSCGLDYRYSLDESLHNQIEFVSDDDINNSYIIYKNKKYLYAGTTNSIRVTSNEDGIAAFKSFEGDIMLSWNGHRYIGYIHEYYSYTSDNPIFIYNYPGQVYFREDYSYSTDTFIIKGTSAEIVGEEIFGTEQPHFDFVNPIKPAFEAAVIAF